MGSDGGIYVLIEEVADPYEDYEDPYKVPESHVSSDEL
jgi:hypothetical protein